MDHSDLPERAGRSGRSGHSDGIDRGDRIYRIESEGGEPACWLNLVCEECGKVREGGRCPVCDAEPAGASTGAEPAGGSTGAEPAESSGPGVNTGPQQGG